MPEEPLLEWHRDDEGLWADSGICYEEGDPFSWRIRPPRTRRVWFVLEASPELMEKPERHDTEESAIASAEVIERRMRKEACDGK